MTQKIIGFGGTYYTAWTRYTETYTDGNVSFAKTVFTYIKNLSKDPSEAREKWGTDDIDLDLRGHHTFTRTERIHKPGTFRFGRYEGCAYDVADGGYLGWYYGNGAIDEEKETIENLLIEKHGWVRMEDGRCLSPESYKAELEWQEVQNRTKQLIMSDGPLSFSISYNLNEYGEVMVRNLEKTDDIELCIKFDNFKEMFYQGWPYCLPVDAKGKAKRIKNKTLVINKWEVLSESCIRPIDWEILK